MVKLSRSLEARWLLVSGNSDTERPKAEQHPGGAPLSTDTIDYLKYVL